ncbi:hypothetical protein Cadr_000010289 [Camelus dromedarius]|uniref:Uncharacterized protein n=1 Tax=Camelus dromedarius TaxID=9838 RepID=A0A5N4DWB7_CAMDR|nr:hypothetical protein Cadr_000010289 [Camelus dromedarius]
METTFVDSARAGGGEELKRTNKENSQQPPASPSQLHQETSVTPRRLLESASLRKELNFAENQCIRLRAVSESSAKTLSAATDLPSRAWLWPSCLLATHPATLLPLLLLFPFESSLPLVTLPCPPVQPRPLPCPVRVWHGLVPRVFGCSEPQLQLSRGLRKSNALSPPLILHVNAFVWRNRVGVELGRIGPKSKCSARNGQIKLEIKSVGVGLAGVVWLAISTGEALKRHSVLSLCENHVTAARYL